MMGSLGGAEHVGNESRLRKDCSAGLIDDAYSTNTPCVRTQLHCK